MHLSYTSQIQHALPRRLIRTVPRSHVYIPRGELTVLPAKLDSLRRGVIDILGSAHKLYNVWGVVESPAACAVVTVVRAHGCETE
jgi:hypothetical protein